jgi:pimeloyl-ACP methyl ester carboxylesterase
MTAPIAQTLPVSRGPYGLHAELVPGSGVPVMLMHGFPDSTHLYDRLVPHPAGRRAVVRFDFLGWGRSDKPAGYPYTAANQAGDLAAVVGALDDQVGRGQLVIVAHDASAPPAIDSGLTTANGKAGHDPQPVEDVAHGGGRWLTAPDQPTLPQRSRQSPQQLGSGH